jgi:hypothetical protein
MPVSGKPAAKRIPSRKPCTAGHCAVPAFSNIGMAADALPQRRDFEYHGVKVLTFFRCCGENLKFYLSFEISCRSYIQEVVRKILSWQQKLKFQKSDGQKVSR